MRAIEALSKVGNVWTSGLTVASVRLEKKCLPLKLCSSDFDDSLDPGWARDTSFAVHTHSTSNRNLMG